MYALAQTFPPCAFRVPTFACLKPRRTRRPETTFSNVVENTANTQIYAFARSSGVGLYGSEDSLEEERASIGKSDTDECQEEIQIMC